VTVRLGGIAGLCNSLSRMSGNPQVRFLGEDAAARPHPYPTDPGAGIQEDERLHDFAWMHNTERQRAYRDNVDADDGVLGIQGTDDKLLTIETSKEWAHGIRCTGRIVNCD